MTNIWDNVWLQCRNNIDKDIRVAKATKKVNILLSELLILNNAKVLDYGCGAGYISNELINKIPSLKIYGYDKSEAAIDIAKKIQNPKIWFMTNNSIAFEDEDDKYDLVLLCNVLEHNIDVAGILSEVRACMKKGGKLFTVSSNVYSTMFIERIIRQMIGRWYWGYQEEYTLKEQEKYLNNFGFRTISSGTYVDTSDYVFENTIDKYLSKVFPFIGRFIYTLSIKD